MAETADAGYAHMRSGRNNAMLYSFHFAVPLEFVAGRAFEQYPRRFGLP